MDLVVRPTQHRIRSSTAHACQSKRGSCSRTPGSIGSAQQFWYQMVSFEVCNDGVACSTAVDGSKKCCLVLFRSRCVDQSVDNEGSRFRTESFCAPSGAQRQPEALTPGMSWSTFSVRWKGECGRTFRFLGIEYHSGPYRLGSPCGPTWVGPAGAPVGGREANLHPVATWRRYAHCSRTASLRSDLCCPRPR